MRSQTFDSIELPENLTEAMMMENEKERAVVDKLASGGSNSEKENDYPNGGADKKIKFMMSGVEEADRNRLVKLL